MVLEQDLVTLDPAAEGDVFSPLELAPEPSAMAARLFPAEVLDAHLDARIAAQGEDGGWTVGFSLWTPATELEWRSWVTVGTLGLLRAYGRWS